VLGALAIIIAVLIVINSRGDNQQQPPTVTDTGTPPATAPPPATKTPTGAAPRLRLDWTDRGTIGNSGLQSRPHGPGWVSPFTPSTLPARHGTSR
jgi:serine/threonine-protein kinase